MARIPRRSGRNQIRLQYTVGQVQGCRCTAGRKIPKAQGTKFKMIRLKAGEKKPHSAMDDIQRTEPHSAANVRRSEQIKDCWAITTRFVGVLQGDSTEGGTILCCNRAAVGADCGFSETATGPVWDSCSETPKAMRRRSDD